jgi:hypothetical protein
MTVVEMRTADLPVRILYSNHARFRRSLAPSAHAHREVRGPARGHSNYWTAGTPAVQPSNLRAF